MCDEPRGRFILHPVLLLYFRSTLSDEGRPLSHERLAEALELVWIYTLILKWLTCISLVLRVPSRVFLWMVSRCFVAFIPIPMGVSRAQVFCGWKGWKTKYFHDSPLGTHEVHSTQLFPAIFSRVTRNKESVLAFILGIFILEAGMENHEDILSTQISILDWNLGLDNTCILLQLQSKWYLKMKKYRFPRKGLVKWQLVIS